MMAIFGILFSGLFFSAIAFILWGVVRDILAISQQMHQRPCAKCRYFTNDYRLKCSVHPAIANTEAAINCPDFHPQS
jgi:hypothetical protein